MVARAVSAGRRLTPLAVLVPIGATPVVFALAARHGFVAWLAIPAGLAVTVLTARRTYGVRTGLVAAVSSWLALIVALPFFYALTINTSICGKDLNDSWGWLAPSAGALVFLLLGSVGLRTFRAAAVPVAFLGGVLAMLLLVTVLPGTQGICET